MSTKSIVVNKNDKKKKIFNLEVKTLLAFEEWAKKNKINQSMTINNLIEEFMQRVVAEKKA